MADIIVKQKQTLIDITMEGFGRLDDIVSVSKSNRIAITDQIISNEEIEVDNDNKGVKEVKAADIKFNNDAISPLKTESEKALKWAEVQMFTIINSEPGYFVKFDQDYSPEYTGEVTGVFTVPEGLESIPPSIVLISPSNLSNIYTGVIEGTISLLQPENYEVRVYKKTDIEYIVGTVPVNSLGEWTFGGTGAAGIFVFRIFKV